MKKTILMFALIATLAACGSTKNEQKTMSEPTTISARQIEFIAGEGVIIEELLKITATVVDIDRENRILTIVDADDALTIFNVTDVVKNFDQISVGNSVVLDGYHALAMELAEPGEEIEESATQVIVKAAPGEKPAMVEVDYIEVLAEVTNIDNQNRMVTVTGPQGNSVDLIVPENIDKFDELKVGDKVNAYYALAFALSVEVVEN